MFQTEQVKIAYLISHLNAERRRGLQLNGLGSPPVSPTLVFLKSSLSVSQEVNICV